ncbi:hypothetical protein V6Z11_D13G012900 [Gossypium hirsutum]
MEPISTLSSFSPLPTLSTSTFPIEPSPLNSSKPLSPPPNKSSFKITFEPSEPTKGASLTSLAVGITSSGSAINGLSGTVSNFPSPFSLLSLVLPFPLSSKVRSLTELVTNSESSFEVKEEEEEEEPGEVESD